VGRIAFFRSFQRYERNLVFLCIGLRVYSISRIDVLFVDEHVSVKFYLIMYYYAAWMLFVCRVMVFIH
jgi:hypothetical protein